MRTSAFLTLLAFSAACSDAEFALVEREDGGGTADAPSGVEVPSDGPPDPLVCEPAADPICTPSACAPVCHVREGSAPAGSLCTVSYGSDPARWDDCAAGNVCLSEGFGVSHCFALCRTAVDCPGRPCAARALAGATSIRVCDPPYRNCSSTSEPCCDPVASAGCDGGTSCYLVPPGRSEDSWTVCEYETGGVEVGHLCTTSRNCLPGLACFLPTPDRTAGECRPVCDPATAGSCAAGTCIPYPRQWGVCAG
jgi:hypothetical protein